VPETMAEEPIVPANGGSDSERSTSTTSAVFAWVGALLVNAAFSSLIGWGAWTNSWIGAILCAVYAAVLFFVSGWLVNRNRQDKPDSNQGNSVLTSLLYLLFVGAVCVTGLLVSMNIWVSILSCGEIYDNDNVEQSTYVTDTSTFRADVVTWYNAGGPQNTNPRPATFGYMPLSDVTIFQGQNGENSENNWSTGLWQMSSSRQAPSQISSAVKNPVAFTLIATNSSDTEAVCFTCEVERGSVVGCTDGATLTTSTTEQSFSRQPYDLYYSSIDGLLWFRATPSNDYDYNYGYWSDNIVYSLGPSDVAATVVMRSVKKESNEPDSKLMDNNNGSCDVRIGNLALLGFVVLPALISSVALYWRRKVPSMPIALYAGLSGFVITLTFVINPAFDRVDILLRWWFFLSSMVWLLMSTGAHLTNRLKASTLSWGINWSSLVYFISVFALFIIPFDRYDNPGSWIGITLVGFLPLMFLSVATGRLLLLVLGAIGLLVDVWRITDVIVQRVDDGMRVPIQFIILALSGLALGMLGYFLSKRQAGLQRRVDVFATNLLGRWRVEDEDDNDEDTPAQRDSLDLAEEGEEDDTANPQKEVATAIVLS
jgi:hypothetical protein